MVRQLTRKYGLACMLLLIVAASGCSSYRQTVPGYCVGNGFEPSRTDKEPINFLRLRQEPPAEYRLDERDVLGIYIEGVLGNKDEPPPVQFPEAGDDAAPSVGYPVPVREDGTVSLPLIEPVSVRGLTIGQVEQTIRNAYIRKKILKPERERIIVTLMRPRTYHVLVVREDETSGSVNFGNTGAENLALQMAFGQTRRGMSFPIELKAYENDVLHALSETGGLPGNDAKNEVIVLRGAFATDRERENMQNELQDPNFTEDLMQQPNVIKIPLRVGPNDPIVQLSEEDIILNPGDIVFVRSRETEVFYTGGLLPAGQFPIPRDYDIDILQAIAIAGGSVGSTAGATGSSLTGANSPIFPATRIIVLRELCGETVPIEINTRRAMVDPAERIRVQPGDFILLEYTTLELIANIAVSNLTGIGLIVSRN